MSEETKKTEKRGQIKAINIFFNRFLFAYSSCSLPSASLHCIVDPFRLHCTIPSVPASLCLPPASHLFVVVEPSAEVERQGVGAVVVHSGDGGGADWPVDDPRGRAVDGEEVEVVTIEEIGIPLLPALGILGERLSAALLAVEVVVVVVEKVEGADGRRELPHHVAHGPNDGAGRRAKQLHGRWAME